MSPIIPSVACTDIPIIFWTLRNITTAPITLKHANCRSCRALTAARRPLLALFFRMISFANIHKQYGKQLVFVDASFQLNPGEKVGLVGPNGSGKTTLFRMVVGEDAPDEGEVSVPKRLTIGYFRQDVEEMRG